MARKRRETKPLPTIWEVSDPLWDRIEPILREDWQASPKGGRPPAKWRSMFNGIIHRLRSGCQWNYLPKVFGSDRTIHRWFQRWCRHGVMQRIWASLLEECDDLGEVHWQWQSADGAMGKARFGGEKGREKPYGSGQSRHQKKLVGR
jgi:putative transposase